MKKVAICIVNYNCLTDTKELFSDLNCQDYTDYHIYFYDQNSSEPGTKKFIESLEQYANCTITLHDSNRPLNHIWNEFAMGAPDESRYLTFLNNDIRVPSNYLSDTVEVLDNNERLGAVVHATNNRRFSTASKPTKYILENGLVKQGWEFTLRKDHWENIPEQLKFYCGDDFVFGELYKKGLKTGVVTSSPVIHKLSKTRKNMPQDEATRIRQQAKVDIATYKKLGFTHIWNNIPKHSKLEPEFNKIIEINQNVKKSQLKDYEGRLRNHLNDTRFMDGCIIDINTTKSEATEILKQVAGTLGKPFHKIHTMSPIPDNVDFAFIGVFDFDKITTELSRIWEKVRPGSTIFFPYYHYEKCTECKNAVNQFFSDKRDQVVFSRPQTKPGVTDSYLAIKCFKTGMDYRVNDKPLIVASVLKTGGIYDETYVNRLAKAVKRHMTLNYKFVCLTDADASKLNLELVDEVIPLEYDLPGWWSKMELFRPELFNGCQVLYFDLDTLIVNNIDDFGGYGGSFMGLRDFNTMTDFGSGVMGWEADSFHKIFYKSMRGLISQRIKLGNYRGGDQELIEQMAGGDRQWVQDLFPNKIAAFRYECFDESQWIVTLPEKASVICFHGHPKMADLHNNEIIKEHWRD
jgi:GT2 family glycosyltransferase